MKVVNSVTELIGQTPLVKLNRLVSDKHADVYLKLEFMFMTQPELLDKIVGLLGGRVAEEIQFGEVSTGAHNDFQRATGMARLDGIIALLMDAP